jgi:protein-disulfide isomerase
MTTMITPTLAISMRRPGPRLRKFLMSIALLVAMGGQTVYADDAADTSREAILSDPATPVAGNPRGDLTIVVFFDYNCPYCKKSEPDLERLVKADGKIRLVFKDWPILTEASVTGAQLALAARYQGKYDAARNAMMSIPGLKIPADQMRAAVAAAGVDMDRLDADLNTHGEEITALLRRNLAQAESIGLQGTPGYLVGPYRVTVALNYDGFKRAVADARALAAKSK